MPTATIDCTSVNNIHQDDSNIISTSFGLTLLEIQGELNLPTHLPQDAPKEIMDNFIKVDDIHDAIRFGNLVFDEKDSHKVTLFIGKSQRLLGSIEKLKTPLGVLKIPLQKDNDDAMDTNEDIKMVDIVKYKLLFKQRPLPIM